MAHVRISTTTADLSEQLAEYVAKLSNSFIAQKGKFHVAISGGSLPGLLSSKLRNPPYASQVDWANWVVWFVDERYVPLDHNDSNYKEARKLFDHVGILPANIRTAKTNLPLKECAADYEQQLKKDFGDSELPSLDLILLGLGPDGHTASLFPNHALLHEKTAWIAHVEDSPKPPPQRITFTLPLINKGKHVAFVATGDSKKEVLARILEEDNVPWGSIPANVVKPWSGNLLWFVDKDATKALKKSYL